MEKRIAILGSVVRDQEFAPLNGDESATKITCSRTDSWGGGVTNGSRAVSRCGVTPIPLFFVGTDHLGDQAMEELAEEFSDARFSRAARQTRQSVLLRQKIYTLRPVLQTQQLPDAFRQSLRNVDLAIIAPMAPEDCDIVESAVRSGSFTVLQLSAEQLRSPETAYRLMSYATITVLNVYEATVLSGVCDPVDSLRTICERSHRGLVITTEDGAYGLVSGCWEFAPAISLTEVRKTAGAGDCFAGTFAASLAMGRSLGEALALGQAAAGRHVAGLIPLGDLASLEAWAEFQPKRLPFEDRRARQLLARRPMRSIAAATGLAVLATVVAWFTAS